MTMRVTEMTKRDTVVGNLQKNNQRLQNLQSNLATGRKIARTSDDPIGATVVQDIITGISQQEQLIRNAQTNISWLERNEVELEHIAELMDKAKTLVLSQSGDSASDESRTIVAQELRSIQQSLMDAANARSQKLYLFSGKKTLTPPFRLGMAIQPAKVATEGIEQKDVAELLDVTQFKAQFEGNSSHPYRVKITQEGPFGRAGYQISDDGGETWSKDKILLPTIEVRNEDGQPDDEVLLRFTDDQGLIGALLPEVTSATGAFSVSEKGVVFPAGLEFIFVPNPPIQYVGSRQKKEVLIADGITLPVQVTAEELFMKTGPDSVDTFEVFGAIIKALEANDHRTIPLRLEELEKALNQVLAKRADIGNTMRALQEARDKLENQIFSKQSRLSEIQDLNVAESSVTLNQAERDNRLSLEAGGRLIQPSLMEFLR